MSPGDVVHWWPATAHRVNSPIIVQILRLTKSGRFTVVALEPIGRAGRTSVTVKRENLTAIA